VGPFGLDELVGRIEGVDFARGVGLEGGPNGARESGMRLSAVKTVSDSSMMSSFQGITAMTEDVMTIRLTVGALRDDLRMVAVPLTAGWTTSRS